MSIAIIGKVKRYSLKGSFIPALFTKLSYFERIPPLPTFVPAWPRSLYPERVSIHFTVSPVIRTFWEGGTRYLSLMAVISELFW